MALYVGFDVSLKTVSSASSKRMGRWSGKHSGSYRRDRTKLIAVMRAALPT